MQHRIQHIEYNTVYASLLIRKSCNTFFKSRMWN